MKDSLLQLQLAVFEGHLGQKDCFLANLARKAFSRNSRCKTSFVSRTNRASEDGWGRSAVRQSETASVDWLSIGSEVSMILSGFLAQGAPTLCCNATLSLCTGVAMSILLFVETAHVVFWVLLRACHSH